MATEPDLETAAENAWNNLMPFWIAGTAATRMTAFVTAVLAALPEQQEGAHPAVNWVIQIQALASTMNANPQADVGALRDGATLIYHTCFMANQLNVQTLITAGQAAAILAAYNAQF